MKLFTFIFLLVILSTPLISQQISNQLLSSAGQVSQNKNILLEWSLGELATTSIYTTSNLYTQGFHQPVLLKRSFDDKVSSSNVEKIEIWPNPSQNYFSVEITNSEDLDLTFALFDINGERVKNIDITGKETRFIVNIEKLIPGFYYLKIYNSKDILIDHQKVIKSN